MYPCPHRNVPEWSKLKQSRAKESLPKPYLLFDAGGTLVFPDQRFLIHLARKHGIELTDEQLFNGYYQLIYTLDREARNGGDFSDPWPQGYTHALFEELGMVNAATHAVAQAAQKRHRKRNLWTFTFDWIHETLSRLAAQKYRMSVISNSDGRTTKVFRELGLDHFFENIFDSALLGIEKPDPAIFEWALCKLNLTPAEAIYIGDVFEVDVRGANEAGLRGLHLDPLDLYANWPGVHLPDVSYLPNWLLQYATTPWAFDLFPTRKVLSACSAQTSSVLSRLRINSETLTETSESIWPCNQVPHTHGDKP